MPNTVVGTLVDDKTYPDPMYGMNLKNLPGMNYPDKQIFAVQDMPEEQPLPLLVVVAQGIHGGESVSGESLLAALSGH